MIRLTKSSHLSNTTLTGGLAVFAGDLYAGAGNSETGAQLWRTADGSDWEQANLDGFNDSNNTRTNWSNATENFLNQLYVGTSNVTDGGELWRMNQPYGVELSPDDSLSGPAGEQVVYTIVITNTGDVVDTLDLLPTGNIWTTMLSSQVVTLAAGDSQAVMITVSIPLSAAAMDSDQVTLLAVSQHDVSAQDTAILTTVSTGLAVRLYLPAITRN